MLQESMILVLFGLSVVDIRKKTIPVCPTGIAMAGYLVAGFYMDASPVSILLGSIGVMAFFWLVWWFSRGQIGAGDILLFGLTGSLLGLWSNVLLVLLSFGYAFLIMILLFCLRKVKRDTRLPMAPCIFMAYISVLGLQ